MKLIFALLVFPSLCFSAVLADLKVSPAGVIGGTFFDSTEITPSLFKSANSIQGTLVAGTDYLTPTGNGSGLTGLTKSQVSLGSVENTALSTWAGTSNITTLGTISTGVWNGTSIGDSYISSAATWNAKEPAISAGTTGQYWRGDKSWQTLNASAVGLGSVENTALSTWAGTSNITTLGTIATGTWSAGTIALDKGGTGQTTNTAAFDALAPTTTQGDTIYYNGTDNVRLAKGTAAQVLTMNAGATAPEWATPAAGGVSSITGTANQVVASASTGAVTLSLPQSIATSSAVQFGTVSVGTSATTGTHTIQGAGTTTGKSFAIRNSSGTTTAYIQDNGNFVGAGATSAAGTNSISFGSGSTAAASHAFVLGYSCSAPSGGYSVAMGNQCSVTYGVAIGTTCSTSGGASSGSTAMGYQSLSTAESATAIGYGCSASAQGAFAMCYQALADRWAMVATSGGGFSAAGDSQTVTFSLRCKTTTNSPVEMALNGSTTYLTIPSGKMMTGILTVLGVRSDGDTANTASYIRKVAIINVAGTLTLLGTDPDPIGTDLANGTSLAITANSSGDYLSIKPTGTASQVWRWTASFQGVETAYGN